MGTIEIRGFRALFFIFLEQVTLAALSAPYVLFEWLVQIPPAWEYEPNSSTMWTYEFLLIPIDEQY
jgi:hypothetical protein